jgi:hypothetical protein
MCASAQTHFHLCGIGLSVNSFKLSNTRLGPDISRIRIIKLAERERLAQALVAKRLASASHIAQAKARDAAATITGWISHWRQQKEQSAETLRDPKITDSHTD